MAFKKKAEHVLSLRPDILVVQECANMEKLKPETFINEPFSVIWRGHNPNKGFAVFGFGENKLKLIEEPGKDDKWFIPVAVKGKHKFNLIAVWAMYYQKNEVKNGIGPTFATLSKFQKYMKKDCLIIGDFNDNQIWDYRSSYDKGNFIDCKHFLDSKGLKSCYHHKHGEDYGKESKPTLWWMKNLKKTYHIDYCFAGQEWLDRLKTFEIGKADKWFSYSDHAPIIVDF